MLVWARFWTWFDSLVRCISVSYRVAIVVSSQFINEVSLLIWIRLFLLLFTGLNVVFFVSIVCRWFVF